MIIGNGDIAKVLPKRDDFLFFASGVSNSQETRQHEFAREKDLLFSFADQIAEKRLKVVYFGSLSIFYADTPYTRHKRRMEQMVKMFENWCIVRIGNITWGNNPHTLINFFKNELARGRQLRIQDTFRYVVNQEEFLYWISMIPSWNCEINIPGRRMKVVDVVKEYVNSNH